MLCFTEVNHSILTNIKEAPLEELNHASPRARFNSISLILNRLDKVSPPPKDDPEYPIDEDEFSLEIGALTNLSKSIRYSNKYSQFSQNVTDITLRNVKNNEPLIENIVESEKIGVSDKDGFKKRIDVINSLSTMQLDAMNEVFGFTPLQPIIKYNCEPKKFYPRQNKFFIVTGIMSGAMDERESPKIFLNRHPDSHFPDIIKIACTNFHEHVHMGQMHLARKLHYRESRLLELDKDALLYKLLEEFNAVIPSRRLSKPYFEQFHEVDAFDQAKRFGVGLQNIVEAYKKNPSRNDRRFVAA